MLEKLKTTDTKKKTLLLCAAWALFAALYIAARLILRQGKLMLFRFNLGFSIEDAGILYNFQTLIVLAVSAVVLMAAVYLLRRELRYEVFFSALALVFGLFYMFTITPLSVPDEVTHFQAIIELTSKLFSKPFDASVGDFTAFSNHNNVCTAYLRIIHELFGKAGDTAPLSMSIMGGMWTLTYSLEYVPQIRGCSKMKNCYSPITISATPSRLRFMWKIKKKWASHNRHGCKSGVSAGSIFS